MRASNVIALILGVFIIIGGIYCMLAPDATYSSLAWLLGIVMVVDGVADAVAWMRLRSRGYRNGWALLAAIISIAIGAFVLGSTAARFAVDLLIAYLIAAWLIVTGAMRMLFGWSLRRVHVQLNVPFIGSNWWATFALGVLLVIVGVFSVFNPTGLMLGVGMLVGLSIVVAGISVVTLAL